MENENLSSGVIGFCKKTNASRGIVITWTNNTVTAVNCEHKTCGYADSCELYQQRPIGYVESFPIMSRSSENPGTIG